MAGFWRPDVAPDREPLAVRMARGRMVDSIRGERPIPLKLYYPIDQGGGKLPLILWSHGLGGSVDGASFLSRFIASHGFMVLHVQHKGTDSGLWEGKPGHPWDIIRSLEIPRSATLARFADIPFVLDNLPAWVTAEAGADTAGMVDMTRIGMSGHSFGAMTTQVMLGQRFPDEAGILTDYADPRFACGIFYSPVPAFHLTGAMPSDIYGDIDRPAFHMTGTADSSPVEGFGYEKRLVIYEHSHRAEKMQLVLKDGDHMIYNGSRGKLGENPNREKHETIIKMAALAYWQAKLAGDEEAAAWLTDGGFATYLNGDGTFRVG